MASTSPRDGSWPLLAGLSRPALVLDEQGSLVFVNARAEAFWGVRLVDAVGRNAREVTRLCPAGDLAAGAWGRAALSAAIDSGEALAAQTVGGDGKVHRVEMTVMGETRDGRRYAQIIVNEPGFLIATPRRAAPRDPVTGLPLLLRGTADRERWDARCGTAVVFDLHALRETNALYGTAAGDEVLAAAGTALSESAPPGALAARYGKDELVLLVEPAMAGRAEGIAESVARRAASAARAIGVPVPPTLDHGAADFGPGGLDSALRRAADVLYEGRGALLPAASGGRIVLTREGRAAVQEPDRAARVAAPGGFAAGFAADFERYFKTMYARATDQARDFVEFVSPDPGCAAVEVGAGSGRITFDGGLAGRIGSTGRLLVTDPSAAQLDAARKRAAELGLQWVRFVCAPVEALPVEPGTADLCLGATFLHFTEPGAAIRAMARAVRPGGRVAVTAALGTDWPPAWQEILEPVHRLLKERDLPLGGFLSRAQIEQAYRDAGLAIEAAGEAVEQVGYPSADIAAGIFHQTRFVDLMLRHLPPEARRGVAEAVEARLRDVWSRAAAGDLTHDGRVLSLVGRR